MALTSRSRNWSFAIGDVNHSIGARIESRGVAITLTISADGEAQVQKKASDLAELWGDYPIYIEQCTCAVRAFRKGALGVATDFELRVEGQMIAEGDHPTIECPEPESRQSEGPAPESQIQAALASEGHAVPTIPVLPTKCPNCGGALAMDEVRWVGPLTARCPYCGTNVPIEWRRIGE